MECEEVLRHLFAYLDGELESERHQQVSAHIERCRGCFSRAEFERRLKTHLLAVGRTTVPAALQQRVRTVLDGLMER